MLYNKAWDTKGKPSLKGCIAWLEQQDPSETYLFRDMRACAARQYLNAVRVKSYSSLHSSDIDDLFKKEGVGQLFAKSSSFGELLGKLKTLT